MIGMSDIEVILSQQSYELEYGTILLQKDTDVSTANFKFKFVSNSRNKSRDQKETSCHLFMFSLVILELLDIFHNDYRIFFYPRIILLHVNMETSTIFFNI